MATGLANSVFIPIPKKAIPKDVQTASCKTALISCASKIMLKILQARLQRYMNQEFSYIQAGFTKGRGKRSNCQHLLNHRKRKGIPEKKKTYFCFIDYTKTFDCVDHNKLWKILKIGIPDHCTCLLRNLYEG